jgi:DNA-3-methyladenine glycosylase I
MAYWYCKIAPKHPVHAHYHNTEYGFPASNERVLFERLSLEIMQAGLSWEIILKKRKALNKAFDNFRVPKIAAYGAKDIERLLNDATIIRNRLKIRAIITNAKIVLDMRSSHKGFAKWLAAHHPKSKKEWVKLFRKTFKFTGGEITGEFLMSIGLLPGAHCPSCGVYKKSAVRKSVRGKCTRRRRSFEPRPKRSGALDPAHKIRPELLR